MSATSRATIGLAGMSCASCAARIEKALAETPGVAEAAVNFALAQAAVTYDPTVATPEALKRVVESAGYEATWIQAQARKLGPGSAGPERGGAGAMGGASALQSWSALAPDRAPADESVGD